jgi:hypothetical protein
VRAFIDPRACRLPLLQERKATQEDNGHGLGFSKGEDFMAAGFHDAEPLKTEPYVHCGHSVRIGFYGIGKYGVAAYGPE